MLKRWIGDKQFYKAVLTLALPLVVQQAITSFVSLLDNVMVGGLSTESISAVAVVNQILLVFNLSLFGGLSGASIFGAQFFGKGDMKGMRETFRFKMVLGVVLTILCIILLSACGETFVSLFLQGENDVGSTALALSEGMSYLNVMLWGLFPFMVVQSYVSSLRETGETVAPMIASVIAILVNLVLNYVLIFGHFGFPRLGVTGAAIATVISRYVEMFYILLHAHRHQEKYHFLQGAYASLHMESSLLKKIIVTGSPLMFNEVLWSLGMTFINQSYSSRGLAAVAAVNITSTAWNLFSVVMMAMGSAVAIMVGQKLGVGDKEGARDIDRKLVFLTVVMHVIMGALLVLASGLIPKMYNVEEAVRETTRQLLVVAGLSLPLHSFVHVVYFTIRSGGKTVITFLFDCVYTWLVPVALAYVLCTYTAMPIVEVYFCIQFIDIIKVIIGALMLRSDFWANNVVNEVSQA